ncbi:MAG TPA: phage tail protein [Candidatus Acidoferrales bacterium]|nr:phage tail protein [Candidatus Acidoferrales bacterium]
MSEHTRRQFLGRALPGAVVASAGLTVLQPAFSVAAEPQLAPAKAQGYAAARYGLELDKQFGGWVESADGGDATAPVVIEKLGPDHIQHKHLAGVKYEDITVNCGTGMSRGFYDWIKASFDKQFIRKNGAVVFADYAGKQNSRMDWSNALISEVGFPACDAASKDAGKLTVKISPEFTRRAAATQGPIGSPRQMAQKRWLSANFRLKIDGLDCSRVNKIEAITVKTVSVANPVGELRTYEVVPAHLEVPNLAVTTAESFAADFYRWHEDFVIKGNNGRDKERGGTLEFLTPDLRESLFTLTFRGLGIFKLAPEKVEAGIESIRRVKAEMYCEDIGFAYGAGTWA